MRGVRHLRRTLRDGNPSTLIRCKTRHGLTFALDPDSIMDAEVIHSGYYEPEILEAILQHLPERGVFWDCGANIGIHAISVQHLRPQAQVFAFEPAPAAMARLALNAHMNASPISIMGFALGPGAGYAPMSIKVSGNTGIASISPWPGSQYDGQMTVHVESGDALVGAGVAPAPSVLKIDVEGFEHQVLLGLGRTLAAADVALIFESAGDKLPPIADLLAGHGFRVSPIDAGRGRDSANYLARKA